MHLIKAVLRIRLYSAKLLLNGSIGKRGILPVLFMKLKKSPFNSLVYLRFYRAKGGEIELYAVFN